MFKLGQRVVIVADSFEQGMPIGEYGYLIGRDRNPDSAFSWIVRIPKIDKQFAVVEDDIALEETLREQEAERIQKEALLDYALATRNEALFRQLMGIPDETVENGEPVKESMEEFIRKVNIKAWI
ncbi:ATPase [Brevibacillus composti]|uniref:ATPase n=1 Tax=Brevibacillus composti TaxID=2796470 RepID=A0A7T5EHZ3_9BACL|nr:ATPase [Brevibacillus composti]QQE72970.1 ATPase [Brevibacillus composti]QUO40048.1 ATPase [Brevibacillus composti]